MYLIKMLRKTKDFLHSTPRQLTKAWKIFRAPAEINAYLATHNPRKLNVGTGWTPKEGWLNTDIDLALSPGSSTTYLDGTKPFPIPSASFDYIFNEHMIEHISYGDAVGFLRECHRILKPGGKIRIATPDLRFLIELYNNEKTPVQERYIKNVAATSLAKLPFVTDAHVINHFYYGWGHIFIFDAPTLIRLLGSLGFHDPVQFSVGESDDPELIGAETHGKVIGKEFNDLETMVIQATKH